MPTRLREPIAQRSGFLDWTVGSTGLPVCAVAHRHEALKLLGAGTAHVAVFTLFLLYLLAQGLSRKTRNLHRDNLRLHGGEMAISTTRPN